MIQAVLFDMDGVLVDSEEYITEAGIAMFKEKAYAVKAEDFKEFTGMGENRFLGGVAEKYGIPFDQQKDKARAYQIYEKLVKNRLKPLKGVNQFIAKCKSESLQLAVASSADKIKVRINLKEIGISENIFQAIVNGEEVKHKKPNPEIFLLAAKKLGIEARNCLVVEDAISGIEAAKAAGCKCLAVTTSFSLDKLSNADWITDNLSMFPDACLQW